MGALDGTGYSRRLRPAPAAQPSWEVRARSVLVEWEEAENFIDYRDVSARLANLVQEVLPVAPPTEEWEDPEPWQHHFRIRHGNADRNKSCLRGGCVRNARSREQYEADQKPVVPVDALGFPTQRGATFSATPVGRVTRRDYRVIASGVFTYVDADQLHAKAYEIDPTSIEDVRPAAREHFGVLS